MAKEDKITNDNSFGTSSVILGILSIIFSSIPGLILGITALVFAMKQKKIEKNKWSKWGMLLSIIGIILSIIISVAAFYATYYGAQLGNLGGLQDLSNYGQ